MNIKIVRGAFLNPFELQNYYPLQQEHNLTAISSKRPVSAKVDLPLKKLFSPADLPNFPFKYPILNRLFVDAQIMYGLEKELANSDLVHVAETYFGYTYQTIRAKQKGLVKKIVSTVWETIPHNNESLKGRKKIKKLARKNIDHFIAVIHLAKQALVQEGVSAKKITVIPMGVDIQKFKPRPKLKNKRNLNILCVARFVPEKGVLILLEAFLELKKKYHNLSLTFVGNGPLRSELTGFKGVFVKNVPYAKMPQEYSSADIFCLPSSRTPTWEEQFGMCLVEAMASALPIVSTRSGAIPEVCGEAGIIVSPQNSRQLSHALEKLIYNDDIRDKMGKKSRHRAETEFSHLVVAQKINEVYKKLCP